MTKGQSAIQPVEQPVQAVKDETTSRSTQAAGDELPEDDPEHHANDELDSNILLASPEFCRDLDVICRTLFREFGPSEKYPQWEDLRQETVVKFVPWLEENEVETTLKAILNTIVRNLCIAEQRRRKAHKHAHVEVELDEIDIQAPRNPGAAAADLRILFKEFRSRFSGRKLIVFDEHFIEGRSFAEVGRRNGFSAQTAFNLSAQILDELRQLVSSQKE